MRRPPPPSHKRCVAADVPSACTPATTPGAAAPLFDSSFHGTFSAPGSRQAPVSPVRRRRHSQGVCLAPGRGRDHPVTRGYKRVSGDGRRTGTEKPMRVRACWGHLEALLSPPPSCVTIARGHTPEGMQRRWEGPGRRGESMENRVLASVRRDGREGTRPMPRSAQPSRVGSRRWIWLLSFLPGRSGRRTVDDWLCGGAVGGLPQSCRDPRLGRSVARCIGSWDSEPVAGNLGFREVAVYSARLF